MRLNYQIRKTANNKKACLLVTDNEWYDVTTKLRQGFHDSVVVWGTELRGGKSLVWCSVWPLRFFVGLMFPAGIRLWMSLVSMNFCTKRKISIFITAHCSNREDYMSKVSVQCWSVHRSCVTSYWLAGSKILRCDRRMQPFTPIVGTVFVKVYPTISNLSVDLGWTLL